MTDKPPLQFPIARELLLDILSDGMDYAARDYWAQIDDYKWYWWYVPDEEGEPKWPYEINPDIRPDTVLIRMRDDEDGGADEEQRPFVGITLESLEAATQWALTNYNHLLSFSVNTQGVVDQIDYDAIGADVIIQRIVLGEVVYG